jgi:hypothetical protein
MFLHRISGGVEVAVVRTAKAALTLLLVFIVTLQVVLFPEHAPDHPVNVELVFAVAVRVTTVPALKVVPVGFEVTVPVPVLVILREYVVVVAAAINVADIVRFAVTLENV